MISVKQQEEALKDTFFIVHFKVQHMKLLKTGDLKT